MVRYRIRARHASLDDINHVILLQQLVHAITVLVKQRRHKQMDLVIATRHRASNVRRSHFECSVLVDR